MDVASDAYSRAWNRWLQETLPDSPHRNQDHSHTLAVPADYRTRSPIGHGLTVLCSVLTDRARDLAGDTAFIVDEDYEQESFVPEWAAVCDAFLHAAMAFGGPELMPASDRDVLTLAWNTAVHSSQ